MDGWPEVLTRYNILASRDATCRAVQSSLTAGHLELAEKNRHRVSKGKAAICLHNCNFTKEKPVYVDKEGIQRQWEAARSPTEFPARGGFAGTLRGKDMYNALS